ncbi:MAG: c-type cytochrome [Gallionella sp.]
MLTKFTVAYVVAGLFATGTVLAADMPELAKKSGCVACHTIEKKLVGPAWLDVANKYKGDAEAPAKLSAKIVSGGKGVWGAVPMPPQAKVSQADVAELVTFILGLAK